LKGWREISLSEIPAVQGLASEKSVGGFMPKGKAEAQTVTVEAEAKRLDLLEAFAELVSERFGYYTARKLKMAEMNEEVKDLNKELREIRKSLNTAIEEYIKEPNDGLREQIFKCRQAIEEKRPIIKERKAPFMKEINPLNKAVRYMDNVAIPDSLKELGYPVQPRFSLSDWVKKGIESQKKRK
jgi:hypothetical protein